MALFRQKAAFRRPFFWVSWALFVYAILSIAAFPGGPFTHYRAADTDDYMRLVQVENLINGQGWYDLSQPRLAPGTQTVIAWSRLVDVPLYLVARTLMVFTDIKTALMGAGLLVPLLLMGGLLLPLARMMARPFVPRAYMDLAAIVVLSFIGPLLFQFRPTRVDHHAYQLLIAGLGFASLIRILYVPKALLPPLVAGLAFALGLWIGGEVFPGLVLFGASLAVIAAWRGASHGKAAVRFGLSFALSSLAILPLARRPEAWGQMNITWFSGAYVIFALLLSAVFGIGWLFSRHTQSKALRLGLYAALGFFAGSLFFLFVPDAILGPYANFDRLSVGLVLDTVREAQPLSEVFANDPSISVGYLKRVLGSLTALIPPLAGIIGGFCVLAFGRRSRRSAALGFATLFSFALFLGTLFWQLRVGTYVQLYALPLVVWLIFVGLRAARANYVGRARFWVSVLCVLALTFLPGPVLSMALQGFPLYPNMTWIHWTQKNSACNLDQAITFLSSPEMTVGGPKTIAASMNDGPELLFRTPHRVLAAPYNVATNRDIYDIFTAREETRARTILVRLNADYVLVCQKLPTAFLSPRNSAALEIKSNSKGKLSVDLKDGLMTFAERLAKERAVPGFPLVKKFDDDGVFLYRVDKEVRP